MLVGLAMAATHLAATAVEPQPPAT
jgi:hypothetical protein